MEAWKKNAQEICAKQPEIRQENDKKRIKNILLNLCRTPTGANIVQWIVKNDILILMDYEVKGAGGYYIPGSKTVCLNAHEEDIKLVTVLAHETRHAWQDSKGFMPTLYTDSLTYLKQIRFIEADATAHEVQIAKELKDIDKNYRLSDFHAKSIDMWKQNHMDIPEALKGKETLWAGFCNWFADPYIRGSYDSGSLSCYELFFSDKDLDRYIIKTEYSNVENYIAPKNTGIDVVNNELFTSLGEMFDGRNYLLDIPVDILRNEQFVGNISENHQERLMALREQEKSHKNKIKHGTLLPRQI